MKLKTLWSDPVGWAEKFAKTPLMVFVWTIVHSVLVSAGLILIYYGTKIFDEVGLSRAYAILEGGIPILLLGVVLPSMYLYAIYRILKILREKELKLEKMETPPEDIL